MSEIINARELNEFTQMVDFLIDHYDGIVLKSERSEEILKMLLLLQEASVALKAEIATMESSTRSSQEEVQRLSDSFALKSLEALEQIARDKARCEVMAGEVSEKADLALEASEHVKESVSRIDKLKERLGEISLESLVDEILRENMDSVIAKATEKIELDPQIEEIRERLLSEATQASEQIEQKATQASQQIEQKASEFDTSMSERASELGALIDKKKALVDSQHEAINTQLAKASLVAQEIREQSFQNEIAKTLMLARFDRAINIATLMDTTLTKARIHLHEADIKQKRNEVEAMMNAVELDRQEVAKAKNDAKAFIDRASNAQAHAEFNSFLEVI